MENCAKCDAPLQGHYAACDRTMHCYCLECFDKTPCGKGRHGEECPTQIYENDDASPAGQEGPRQ